MIRGKLWVIALLAGLCGTVLLGQYMAASAAPPKPKQVRIGVIEVSKVRLGYDKLEAQQTALEAFQKQQRTKGEALEKEVEQLELALSIIKDTTPEYAAKKDQWIQKKIELQVLAQASPEMLKEKRDRALMEFYRDVDAAVNKYAKENGYDIIVKLTDPAADDEKRSDTYYYQYAKPEREIVYYSDAVDVTEDVVELINSLGR